MKRSYIFPAAIVALASLTAACGSSSTTATPATVTATTVAATAGPATTVAATAGPATAGPATAAPAGGELPMTASVSIASFKFSPKEVHIAVGGTVTWTNNDNQRHTATASGTFDAGAIAAGASASATFDTAGTYAYICSFHPFMKGTVIVG